MVDWSYDMLGGLEVYRRLSGFRGVSGAAAVVCASKQIGGGRRRPRRGLDRLVAGHPRSSRHRTAVPHARDDAPARHRALRNTGELEDVWRTHQQWVLDLTTEAGSALDGPDRRWWLAAIDAEARQPAGRSAAISTAAIPSSPSTPSLRSALLGSPARSPRAQGLGLLLAANTEAPPDMRPRASASGFLINMLGRPPRPTPVCARPWRS